MPHTTAVRHLPLACRIRSTDPASDHTSARYSTESVSGHFGSMANRPLCLNLPCAFGTIQTPAVRERACYWRDSSPSDVRGQQGTLSLLIHLIPTVSVATPHSYSSSRASLSFLPRIHAAVAVHQYPHHATSSSAFTGHVILFLFPHLPRVVFAPYPVFLSIFSLTRLDQFADLASSFFSHPFATATWWRSSVPDTAVTITRSAADFSVTPLPHPDVAT